MKKLVSVLMAAAMILCMAACGNDEKVIGEEAQSGAQSGEAQSGQSGSQGSYNGYAFTAGGTTVQVDADFAPVLEKLGEPLSYFEAASCAVEGLDKTYTYSGFQIITYPDGEKDCVSTIVLKDDSVSTAEGVSIGESKERLQEVYGSGSEEGNMIVYAKGDMKLCFIMQNDEIASIEYRSKVLEV